jgi:DNA-binding FadR family transcriptional regulator
MTLIASCGSMKQSGMRSTVRRGSDGIGWFRRDGSATSAFLLWPALGSVVGTIVPNTGTLMDPLDRTSVPDQVFRRLAADVIAGRHAPGERLPTQRRLAAELGVNIASVREGIKRLEQLKLLDVRHGDAMRVRDWRAHGGLDVLVHALGGGEDLDREVLRSVMEARRLLLTESARLAAQRREESQAELLVQLAAELPGASSDEAAQGIDFAFFATLIQASQNLVLLLIANSIRDLYFQRLGAFRAIVRDRASLAEHYETAAAAIDARDPDTAATAVEQIAAAQERAMLERLA